MKVQIASGFNTKPEYGTTIPAAEYTTSATGFKFILPIIGFYCVAVDDCKTWGFFKYTPPSKTKDKETNSLFINTRIAHVSCSCGFEGLYPVGNKDKATCPYCRQKFTQVDFIKEGSDDYFNLLNPQLKQQLEDRTSYLEEDIEFRYPELLIIGKNITMTCSNKVFDYVKQAAINNFVNVQPASENSFAALAGASLALQLDVTSGSLDLDTVKSGWEVNEGIVTSKIKIPFLKEKKFFQFESIKI